MEPLVHKASVHLTTNRLPRDASLGDVLTLRLQSDGKITATWVASSRIAFGFGRARELVLGYLGQRATDLLGPALERSAHLRVRIVEIEPAHLNSLGNARLFISVWGDPKVVMPTRPKHKIFSRSRINDGPAPEDEG